MPRRSGVVGPPNSYVRRGGSWPDGPFLKDAPPTVLVAAEITRRLVKAVESSGLSVSEVARGLGIHRSTYYDVINGNVVPDLHTLTAAQRFFEVDLWPRFPYGETPPPQGDN